MFVGTFERTLDSSNRFRLPREILRELAPNTAGRLPCLSISGECLLVFPPEPFREVVERFSIFEISDPQRKQISRDIFANTENCKVDGVGRMMLPANSRGCAGIDSAVVVVGAGKYFEIWSRERFRTRSRRATGESLKGLLGESGLTV